MKRGGSGYKWLVHNPWLWHLLGFSIASCNSVLKSTPFLSVLKLNVHLAKKNVCVFQVSALKKLGMVGWHYHFISWNTLYRYCIFNDIFHHFSAQLTIFSSLFTIKSIGSGQKPRQCQETWNTAIFLFGPSTASFYFMVKYMYLYARN